MKMSCANHKALSNYMKVTSMVFYTKFGEAKAKDL